MIFFRAKEEAKKQELEEKLKVEKEEKRKVEMEARQRQQSEQDKQVHLCLIFLCDSIVLKIMAFIIGFFFKFVVATVICYCLYCYNNKWEILDASGSTGFCT